MRRPFGTGSISQVGEDRWEARIYLRGGQRKMRRRRSEAEALAAIDEMLAQYKNELGYFYSQPRRFFFGKGQKRQRAGIGQRGRFRVLERDGFRCVYCGATAEDGRLVVDHIQPVADGGTDDLANLATACGPCNAGKADRSLLNLPVILVRRASQGE